MTDVQRQYLNDWVWSDEAYTFSSPCLDKGRQRYDAAVSAERHSKPRAEVRRWPRRTPVGSPHFHADPVAPWRVRFFHRGEETARYRRFVSYQEAIEFAEKSWYL